jgi:hypothetical protein
MPGFAVDHSELARAGQQISQHGSSTSGIAKQVQAAEVPTLAWGLLGVSCGLYEMYLGMLNDLDQHLNDMGQHLDQTGSAMVSNAQTYQDVEQAIAKTMQHIAPGTESA